MKFTIYGFTKKKRKLLRLKTEGINANASLASSAHNCQ